MMKDFSSFEKKADTLKLSGSALKALKEVARQTRHYKNPAGTVIFGRDGYFNKVLDSKDTLSLKSDRNAIIEQARALEPNSNCALFAHGHLKGLIIDGSDVYFDYRLLSSSDLTNLVDCRHRIGEEVKLYLACVSCDDLGNATMQILSYDGNDCYQYTNLQVDGSGRLSNDAFEELIKLETVNAKF